MSDFDNVFASLFVSPDCADAFILGFGVCLCGVIVCLVLPLLLDLGIDMIRDKLGLPVARYVRWVKQEEKKEVKDGEK